MVRQPVVAGQFYPGTRDGLRTMIKKLVDEGVEREEVLGAVSPHAGYIYSGYVAGAVISRIRPGDVFVIMGPNHTGMGKAFAIMAEGSWRTPLGDVEIDSGLAKMILGASDYIEEDEVAHRFEHSIEVQVPFLQYFKPDIRIVPIVLSQARLAIYREIGRALAEAIKGYGNKVVLMASSDMTHYEPHESARKKDKQAIDAILKLDEEELVRRVTEIDISMCGYAPVTCLISACKQLGAKTAELVKYQTSGDTSGDYSSVVGYAGIIVK